MWPTKLMPESNLRLTRDEEQELITYIDQRLTSLEAQNRDRIDADKRSLRSYERDKSDRAGEAIYARSNYNIPLISLVVDHFSSRSEEEITGSSPFFNMRPKGETTPDESMAVSRFLRDSLDGDGKLRHGLNENFQEIFTQRAVIHKAIHKEEVDEWEEYDRIALFDKLVKDFVIDENGEYLLYGEIEWEQDIDLDAEGGETGIYRPVKVPTVKLPQEAIDFEPGDPAFAEMPYEWGKLDKPIKRTAVLEKGARSIMVDSDKFLAPMNAKSLDDADFIAEVYERSNDWVANSWLKAPGREPWRDAKTIFENGDRQKKLDAEDERTTETDEEDAELGFDDTNPTHRIHEIWITRSMKKGKKPIRFMVRYCKDEQRLIYYEYASSMLPRPTMRHPYSSIALKPKANKWWGMSLVESLEQDQEQIDRNMNRWIYRNIIATNPIIKYDSEKTVEQKEFSDIKPFEILTPIAGASMAEIMEAFVFPQAEMNTKDIIDRVIFFVQLWLGISNLAQGDSSQMPANPTAFGQDMMLREAGKISKRWSRRIVHGLEQHIEKLAYIALDTMEDKVSFIYSDGNQDIVDYLERQQVESMNLAIELIITKDSTQMTIEANRLSEELVLKYAEFDPLTRIQIRPLYKKNLMSLGYEDVEDLLPVPEPAEITAWYEQQQEMAKREEKLADAELEAIKADSTVKRQQKADSAPKPKNEASQRKKAPQTQSPASGPRG